MSRQGAASFRHLHQTEHAFVHARSARGGNNNHCRVFICAVLKRASDSFTNNRTHRCGEKSKIRYRERDLVTVDHSVSADGGVGESGTFLIILETICVSGHSLKSQG